MFIDGSCSAAMAMMPGQLQDALMLSSSAAGRLHPNPI